MNTRNIGKKSLITTEMKMDKEEFMRQWGVSGMPADKIRLANAAWEDATKVEREACANICDKIACSDLPGQVGEAADAIRMRSNV